MFNSAVILHRVLLTFTMFAIAIISPQESLDVIIVCVNNRVQYTIDECGNA